MILLGGNDPMLRLTLLAGRDGRPVRRTTGLLRLLQQSGAVGLRPLSTVAEDIVKEIGKYAPFTTTNFYLHSARDPDLKRQGAAAEICNASQRYIFYDPDFIESIRSRAANDWPRYFTLAHEIAHHINGDTLLHHESDRVD